MIYHSMSTMKISQEAKEKLGHFRNYPKEPLDSVVKRMLEHYAQDLTLTDEELESVQQGLDDIKAGRVYSHQQIKDEFGLK